MTDKIDLETLRVFRFIRNYIREHGRPPSQREIAAGCLMATTTMIMHLIRLEMSGWVSREYNIPRSLKLEDLAPSDEQFDALWQKMLDAQD